MDPLVTGVVAKAADSAAAETSKGMWGLITRVLGPSADEWGSYLQTKTKRRIANAEKFAEAAARKGAATAPGEVNSRIAHVVLEDGSLFDGEIAAEYFGGILAGSKTPDGRNDTAVSWASTLSGMSGVQIKLHFLLYREWAALLAGRQDLNLAADGGREAAKLLVNYPEIILALRSVDAALDPDTIELLVAQFENAAASLYRLGLIGTYSYGPGSYDTGPFGTSTAAFNPTAPGFELYGWAQGVPNMSARAFSAKAAVFDTEPPTARLRGAVLAAPPPSLAE